MILSEQEKVDLSLIIPCYNEAPHLEESMIALLEVLDQTRFEYEIVFVDDCSQDSTRDIIKMICARQSRCRYIFQENNLGRGGAFKTGFAATEGRIVGFLDIDLEIRALYIPSLISKIELHGFDVVTGYRHYLISQTGHIFRDVLSRSYRLLCKLMLGFGVKDSETGCKFFKRETAISVVLGSESNGWFWDTEVMARASLQNLKIYEMPVLFLRRTDKKTTVRLVPDTWRYLVELFKFRAKIGLSLLNKSPVYWTANGYDLAMKVLYGKQYLNTYVEVSKLIPDGTTVVDICGGSAKLYEVFLKKRSCEYIGLDINPNMVISGQNRGINVKLFDILLEEIPPADYVVMCSSFYQFYRRKEEILTKSMSAARKAVIISESVVHLFPDNNKLFGKPLKWLNNHGFGECEYRFNLDQFRSFAEEHGASSFLYQDGQRNAIAVFKKSQDESVHSKSSQ